MKTLLNRKKGFTLIELMIVVAIIGILAAIAIPNFLRFQLKAKSSEGKTNLAAIRTAEQSYFSEFGSYVSTSAPSPNQAPDSTKKAWAADAGFDQIGWSPEGSVYFNYAVGVGVSGSTPVAFIASAEADIDANGTEQVWGYHKAAGAIDATPATHAGGATCTIGAAALNVDEQVAPCDRGASPAVFGQSEF